MSAPSLSEIRTTAPEVQARRLDPGRFGAPLIAAIALMSAISPLATDMYLPAFPTMGTDLVTDASTIQLTLTTFMIGLALGQLVLGTLSDRIGRRPLLIGGAVVLTVSSALCAVAPSVGFLIAMRFVQGLSGAAGMVLGRAVVADRAVGARAARIFSVLGVIGALSPIAAPILGNVLFAHVGWRGIFWAITGIAAVLLVAIVTLVPETLPAANRQSGGLAQFRRTATEVLSNRIYVGHTLTMSFGFAAIFAYVSASPFLIQNVLGFSSTGFSIIFAVNSVGLMVASAISATIVGRVAPERILRVGVVGLTGATVLLAVVVLFGMTSPTTVLPLLFVVMSSISLIFANGMVLAIGQLPRSAGTASAILGSTQFTLGALVSPLVGLAGENSAVPMALTMLVCGLASAAGHFLIARPARLQTA